MINFSTTDKFDREKKRLLKKYPSLTDDIGKLVDELCVNPMRGASLFGNFRKIRLSMSSKGKGKRGGARVITCNFIVAENEGEIIFVTIYDKNEAENITKNQILSAYETRKNKKRNL